MLVLFIVVGLSIWIFSSSDQPKPASVSAEPIKGANNPPSKPNGPLQRPPRIEKSGKRPASIIRGPRLIGTFSRYYDSTPQELAGVPDLERMIQEEMDKIVRDQKAPSEVKTVTGSLTKQHIDATHSIMDLQYQEGQYILDSAASRRDIDRQRKFLLAQF